MAESRKLAAILAADVVGYSRLAGSDEDRTLARLRAQCGKVISRLNTEFCNLIQDAPSDQGCRLLAHSGHRPDRRWADVGVLSDCASIRPETAGGSRNMIAPSRGHHNHPSTRNARSIWAVAASTFRSLRPSAGCEIPMRTCLTRPQQTQARREALPCFARHLGLAGAQGFEP
jgi:hypothetical protein